MSEPRQHDDPVDHNDDHSKDDDATFQRLRKQNGKTIKGGDRRQRDKAWGRAVNKYHKQRRKLDGEGKP